MDWKREKRLSIIQIQETISRFRLVVLDLQHYSTTQNSLSLNLMKIESEYQQYNLVSELTETESLGMKYHLLELELM